MKEHPIIMSGPMVRAILEGRKTQTRRVVSRRNSYFNGYSWPKEISDSQFDWANAWIDPGPSPAGNEGLYLKLPLPVDDSVHRIYSRYWKEDLLWVRETWALMWTEHEPDINQDIWDVPHEIEYRASTEALYPGDWPEDEAKGNDEAPKWRPSIHMPKAAARIWLKILEVRVQRLQDISWTDCKAEGIKYLIDPNESRTWEGEFERLWDCLNAKRGYSWESNPRVWVISFERTGK